MRPTIALITHFGTRDYFVGTLKGVIKQIAPEADVVDITHEIPSYEIMSASFVLEKTYPFFPAGTIFLSVVDPGVGTQRNILLVEYANRLFIAPNNGLLTPVLVKQNKNVSALTDERYFLITGASTFEARDKMAPVAAYLALGVDPSQLSSPFFNYTLNDGYFPVCSQKCITGQIVYVDKYGNIMTNISIDFILAEMAKTGASTFKMDTGTHTIHHFCTSYEEGDNKPFMITGSHQNLEIAMKQTSASDFLGIKMGQKIRIELI